MIIGFNLQAAVGVVLILTGLTFDHLTCFSIVAIPFIFTDDTIARAWSSLAGRTGSSDKFFHVGSA